MLGVQREKGRRSTKRFLFKVSRVRIQFYGSDRVPLWWRRNFLPNKITQPSGTRTRVFFSIVSVIRSD